jgi:hypothetical protein
MEEYILPFIGDGTFIAMNKYISNNISPKLNLLLIAIKAQKVEYKLRNIKFKVPFYL